MSGATPGLASPAAPWQHGVMLRFALAALLLAALPVTAGPEGRYRLTGVQDAASGIELRADHTFSYGLSYGALDEMAEGVWKQAGDTVLLTTQPTAL